MMTSTKGKTKGSEMATHATSIARFQRGIPRVAWAPSARTVDPLETSARPGRADILIRRLELFIYPCIFARPPEKPAELFVFIWLFRRQSLLNFRAVCDHVGTTSLLPRNYWRLRLDEGQPRLVTFPSNSSQTENRLPGEFAPILSDTPGRQLRSTMIGPGSYPMYRQRGWSSRMVSASKNRKK